MLLHPWDSLFKGASFAPLCLPRCSSNPRSALVTHLPARYLPSLSSCRKVLEMSEGTIRHIMCATRGLTKISSEVERWRSEASPWFSSRTHRWSFHLFCISPHDEPESLTLYDLHQRLTPLPPLREQAAHSKALRTITVRRAQCQSYCAEYCCKSLKCMYEFGMQGMQFLFQIY